MIIDEYDLDEYTRDELIDVIRNQDEYIAELEFQIEQMKKGQYNKTTQEYEENRNLATNLLTTVVNNVKNTEK